MEIVVPEKPKEVSPQREAKRLLAILETGERPKTYFMPGYGMVMKDGEFTEAWERFRRDNSTIFDGTNTGPRGL